MTGIEAPELNVPSARSEPPDLSWTTPTRSRRAGHTLVVLSALPALVATAWLLAAFPLTATGHFRPVTVIPLAVVLTAVIVPLGLGMVRRTGRALDAPWWAVIATVAVAAGFTLFAAATHSQQVILSRDPGSYAQIGYWLAHHPGLTYRIPTGAFGPSPGDLMFGSPAFYEQGGTIIPQFMTGWPTLLAAAGWVAGWRGLLLLPALVGGCAILAIAGLAARLVGARWAPLAALLAAIAWPVLRVSQTPYSEPLAFVLLATGISLLTDVVVVTGRSREEGGLPTAVRRGLRRTAFVAGLVLAGGELVRLDIGVDFALAVPVIGWLWVTRRPGVGPFLGGAAIGGTLGVLDCLFVTRPYVDTNWSSVRLMLIALAVMTVTTVVAAVVLRRSRRWPHDLRWWRPVPRLGAALVVVVAIALVIRPFLLTDHSNTDPGVIAHTASNQDYLGLPIDGTRGYAERSLWWVSWYLGWPLLAAAGIAATVLVWRVLSGRDRMWIPTLMVYLGSSVQTLLRPGITPDHPWADRRLVVEVIPALILLAVWTTARATTLVRMSSSAARTAWTAVGRLRSTALRSLPASVVSVALAVFLVPMVVATADVAADRTEQGELAATKAVCRALRPDDSVVMLDSQWLPTIRSQCGVPVARLRNPSSTTVGQTVASIRSAGRTPVVAASGAQALQEQGLTPTMVVILDTRQDQQELVRRPTSTMPLHIEFWLVRQ